MGFARGLRFRGFIVSWRGDFCLGLAFGKPFVPTVIIGAKSMEQLRDNIDSTRVQPNEAEIKQRRGKRIAAGGVLSPIPDIGCTEPNAAAPLQRLKDNYAPNPIG
jgi:hypothetical protein